VGLGFESERMKTGTHLGWMGRSFGLWLFDYLKPGDVDSSEKLFLFSDTRALLNSGLPYDPTSLLVTDFASGGVLIVLPC